jgi:hypothetical protein
MDNVSTMDRDGLLAEDARIAAALAALATEREMVAAELNARNETAVNDARRTELMRQLAELNGEHVDAVAEPQTISATSAVNGPEV